MMAMTQYTTFNQGQLHVLEMLNRCNSDRSLKELKRALRDFYAKEVEIEANRLWDEGIISEQKIEEWGKEHMRTPYVHA